MRGTDRAEGDMGGEDSENYGRKRKRRKACSFLSSLWRVVLYEGEERYESKVDKQTHTGDLKICLFLHVWLPGPIMTGSLWIVASGLAWVSWRRFAFITDDWNYKDTHDLDDWAPSQTWCLGSNMSTLTHSQMDKGRRNRKTHLLTYTCGQNICVFLVSLSQLMEILMLQDTKKP